MKVPSPVTLQEDSATPEGLISFIILYFNDIHWESLYFGQRIVDLIYTELKICGIQVSDIGSFDSHSALEALDFRILNKDTTIHEQIYRLINPNNKSTIELKWFKTVNKLEVGQTFGELALQYN